MELTAYPTVVFSLQLRQNDASESLALPPHFSFILFLRLLVDFSFIHLISPLSCRDSVFHVRLCLFISLVCHSVLWFLFSHILPRQFKKTLTVNFHIAHNYQQKQPTSFSVSHYKHSIQAFIFLKRLRNICAAHSLAKTISLHWQ